VLTLRKAQIEQARQEEVARLRRVEARLQQIDAQGQLQEPDVVLKAALAQPFLALREVLPRIGTVRRLVRAIATAVPAVVGNLACSIAIVIHGPTYEPDALDFEVGCLLTGKTVERVRLAEERVLTRRTLPAAEQDHIVANCIVVAHPRFLFVAAPGVEATRAREVRHARGFDEEEPMAPRLERLLDVAQRAAPRPCTSRRTAIMVRYQVRSVARAGW
jgi:hypothetical protein